MIQLWYTAIPEELPPDVVHRQLARLPLRWQQRIQSRRRAASRHGSLYGALLLQAALQSQKPCHCLEQVVHSPEGRPYLPAAALDFSVSHSGQYAVCALSYTSRVGVDIELPARRSIRELQAHFSPAEWAALQATDDPIRAFYRLWTQKEAVSKADGRGLDVPLRDIVIQDFQTQLAGTSWHLREVELADPYVLHLASNRPFAASDIIRQRVRF